jgi:diacylglycerol kinase (ATP)
MRVILNPMARHGAGRRLRPHIERELARLGVRCDIVETRASGHAAELAGEAVRAGAGAVIAAGGDGTIHEVVNGLMLARRAGAPVTLGLIPIGTGNDFVKMVPGTNTLDSALATLGRGLSRPVDVGVTRWQGVTEYFANAMGTGIDVEVVRNMRRSSRLPGGLIYISALLRALVKYRAMDVIVDVDGREVRRRIMNLAVCNGPSIGGSFRICPDARTDDGALDVCLIDELSLIRNARLTPRVIRGTHTGQSGVTMARGTHVRVSIDADRPLWFQLDGELRHTEDGRAGVDVSIVAGGLNVICAP